MEDDCHRGQRVWQIGIRQAGGFFRIIATSVDPQVALITIMAQIGSFVPAESATIGVVDKSKAL
jgi:hypothetical protein